jgi:broad specificity phosphatase PhoE
MTFRDIREADPDGVARWARFAPDFAFPGGESIGGFLARVGRVAERMAGCGAPSVLAVTHGGVIRAMVCRLLDLDPRRYLLFEVRPASVTTIAVHDGGGVLVGLSNPRPSRGERDG